MEWKIYWSIFELLVVYIIAHGSSCSPYCCIHTSTSRIRYTNAQKQSTGVDAEWISVPALRFEWGARFSFSQTRQSNISIIFFLSIAVQRDRGHWACRTHFFFLSSFSSKILTEPRVSMKCLSMNRFWTILVVRVWIFTEWWRPEKKMPDTILNAHHFHGPIRLRLRRFFLLLTTYFSSVL